jgi:hypothetical protein
LRREAVFKKDVKFDLCNYKGDPEKEIKRVLGMIVLRGESIVSITAEAPPTQQVNI